MKDKTTDELLDLLHWIRDRQIYRRSCGIVDGPAYAAECRAESEALHELDERGVL